MRCRSTFWRRASSSRRSSGPSKPSTSTSRSARRRALGKLHVLERQRLGHYAQLIRFAGRAFACQATTASAAVEAGPRVHSIERLGLVRGSAPSAAAARRRASPASSGLSAATASISSRRRCSGAPCRSRPRTPPASARASEPDSAFIERSSLITRPSKPIWPRITSRITVVRGRGRALGIERRVDDMRGHRQRHVGEMPEGHEVAARSSSSREASTTGRSWWLSARGAAVAGNVLDHRQHAAGDQPLGGGAAEQRDRLRVSPVGAVADHVVGAGDRHVEHRHAIDVDADGAQIMRHQPGAEPGDLAAVRAGRCRRAGRRRVPGG